MTKEDTKKAATNSKKLFFWIVMLALPLILLVCAEVVLRTFNYGGNFNFVVTKDVLGKTYYTLNRDVARRYFSQQGISIPEAHDDLFEVKKRPNTKRIFMLGESTMAGYPFDYNATAPALLRDRLQQLLPQYNIEVINCGISAISSYTVRDFVSELVEYEPDAFVFYLGHNEFYGAMGIGSTEYLGQSATIVNLYLQMNNLRLFRAMRDGIVKVRNIFKSDVTPREATLMEAMVRTKTILYNSDEYRIARKNFEINIRAILETAQRHNVPVVLSTLVSNLRDQPPLLASFGMNIAEQTRQHWNTLFTKGREEQRGGHYDQAVDFFNKAIALDSLNADAHYFLAKCLDTLGRYDQANIEYIKARDYDGMRFRASSDFNQLIRTLCAQEKIVIADAEQVFADQSPHGLVGLNLLLEHLHPNFDGYALLAKTFFKAIADNGLLGKDDLRDNHLSDEEFKKLSGVTKFDLDVAQYRIFELTNSWPFKRANEPRAVFTPVSYVQQLAVKYVQKRIEWSSAHYTLADWYKGQKKYEEARCEYFAVAKVIPYSYFPYMQMGDVYRMMDQPAQAESTYNVALLQQDSPYLHVRLGMLYFDKSETEKAIEQFERTINDETASKEIMDSKARSMVRFFLGAAYGKNGELQKAKGYLQAAIQLDPQNTQAKAMLEQIH